MEHLPLAAAGGRGREALLSSPVVMRLGSSTPGAVAGMRYREEPLTWRSSGNYRPSEATLQRMLPAGDEDRRGPVVMVHGPKLAKRPCRGSLPGSLS